MNQEARILLRNAADNATQLRFSADCRQCSRLAGFSDEVKILHPAYHARPVPPFGDDAAKLLIIGLAPGMHGANRTGRPFTGDFAGVLLYGTLYRFGFASHAGSASPDDGLKLWGCRITNAVKCLPPENRPEPQEVRQCNAYLAAEIDHFVMKGGTALLALGTIAHQAALMALGLRLKTHPFGHGAVHELPLREAPHGQKYSGLRLYDSYHCSRYNTQTRRLTSEMFEQVFARICADLGFNTFHHQTGD